LRIQNSLHAPITLELLRSSYLSSARDLSAILDYWTDDGVFILQKFVDGSINVTLTARGLIALEEDISTAASDTAFVAMWFASEISAAFDEGIAPAVEGLGLSIGVQSGPPIGAQKGPPLCCEDRLMLGAGFALLAA
ncbi:MAG TPA: hypothetical protein VF440_11165, partial [Novosphingobium sp.]